MKWIIAGALVLTPLLHAQQSRVIEAQAFHLVDESGNVRAELSLKLGEPILALHGAGGGEIALEFVADQPMVSLRNLGGGVWLMVDLNGNPGMSLNAHGTQVLIAAEDSFAMITLLDADGECSLYGATGRTSCY